MKLSEMTIWEAADELNRLYSDEDPITFNYRATTVRELANCVMDEFASANDTTISFYGIDEKGNLTLQTGSLIDMIKDRKRSAKKLKNAGNDAG